MTKKIDTEIEERDTQKVINVTDTGQGVPKKGLKKQKLISHGAHL